LSQRWKRLRRRCSSFSSAHSLLQRQQASDGNNTAPSSLPPRAPGMPPLPRRNSPATDTDMDSVSTTSSTVSSRSILPGLRNKLSQLHIGLRKKRSISVHEVPTFYVPSPPVDDEPISLPFYQDNNMDHHRRRWSSLDRRQDINCSHSRVTSPPTVVNTADEVDRRSTDSNGSTSSSNSERGRTSLNRRSRKQLSEDIINNTVFIDSSTSTLCDPGYCTETQNSNERINNESSTCTSPINNNITIINTADNIITSTPPIPPQRGCLITARSRRWSLNDTKHEYWRDYSDPAPTSLPYVLREDVAGEKREELQIKQQSMTRTPTRTNSVGSGDSLRRDERPHRPLRSKHSHSYQVTQRRPPVVIESNNQQIQQQQPTSLPPIQQRPLLRNNSARTQRPETMNSTINKENYTKVCEHFFFIIHLL
jgi:hypothetical protein